MRHNSSWPVFSKFEIDSVKKLLKTNKVNYWKGKHCKNFEKEFSKYIGVKYAVAVSNGTVALEMALKCLNISKDDDIIVTSRSFVASASCVLSVGARPIFSDVNINTQNIDIKNIKKNITKNTKAIICVHLAGWPCEMKEIVRFCQKNNIYIIEDCSQSHGAKIYNKHCGTFGDISVWSFCNDKIITTGGEGGMVATNRKRLWQQLWSLKDHGRSPQTLNEDQENIKYNYKSNTYGSNFRMIEIQGLLGRIQLKKLNKMLLKRQKYAELYFKTAIKFKSFRVPSIPKHIKHAFYKCYVFVEPKFLKENWNRNKIMSTFQKKGLECYVGSCPELYLEKVFIKHKPKNRLANAKILGETSIVFLVHPSQKLNEIKKNCKLIDKVMSVATKK